MIQSSPWAILWEVGIYFVANMRLQRSVIGALYYWGLKRSWLRRNRKGNRMQIRSLSPKLSTPFNSIKLLQKMYNSWWQLKQFDLSFKSEFQILQSNEKRKTDFSHTHREIRHRGLPNSGFYGFPLLPFFWETRKRICKTVLLNSVLFFPACYAVLRLRDNWSWNNSNPFSYLCTPSRAWKKEKKKEWKKLSYESKTCRLVAAELRINVGATEK